MKLKINFEGKTKEVKIRNDLHFEVQKNTRASVIKSKKTYTRKRKHKDTF